MKSANHHYNKTHKELARDLRNKSTKSEIIIWSVLLRKRGTGFQCQRQRPIDKYIVDFYFPELKLIIEIDGYSHSFEEKIDSDRFRDKRLASLGYETLRISDQMIFEDLENAIRTVQNKVDITASALNIQSKRRTRREKKS